jgi:long-chain acyl-CoA synthetase
MDDTGFIKRLAYGLFLPVGYKVADTVLEHREPNLFWRGLRWLADVTTLEPLRDKIGMSNTRSPYTGGATIGPEIFRFFRALGLDLREIYGSSEAGLCCCHVGGDIKFETIGPPMPGMEAKITEEGELWWKGTSVASGYYKNPEKTAESFAEGWFKSGDAAYLDEDGHIIFLDRMKDMMELAGGKKFAPQFIESRLKFSPYIRDVIVVGGGEERPYPAVLVQIDFAIVGRWAERNHIPYTTFTDLSQKPQVYDLVEKDLMKVNRALPEGGRVKKFICLHKELDPDEAELTRTRKLRREFVETKYGGMLKAMYEDKDAFQAESEIKYRDGRKGKTTTSVQIRKLF